MNALIAVAIGVLIAFAAYAAIASGLRMMRDTGTLRLYRLAAARGVELLRSCNEGELREAALATRRCAGCAYQERCDLFLEKGDYAALRRVCPNTHFLDGLAR